MFDFKRKVLSGAWLAVLASMTVGCGNAKSQDVPPVNETVEELPMPVIPDDITDRNARIAFAGAHFWDGMDFTDSTLVHNDAFMEQNFANFALIVSMQHDYTSLLSSMSAMIDKAAVNPEAVGKIRDIAALYLADANSPVHSMDSWQGFLEALSSRPEFVSETDMQRIVFELNELRKNMTGSRATDFAYETREGKKAHLYNTPSGKEGLLVIFYDTECNHCHDMMSVLADNEALRKAAVDGTLKILAIDVEQDKETWASRASELPAEWLVGVNTDDMAMNGKYWLPALPSLYLLDAEYNIIGRDISPEALSINMD